MAKTLDELKKELKKLDAEYYAATRAYEELKYRRVLLKLELEVAQNKK